MTEREVIIQAQESNNIVKTRKLPNYPHVPPVEGSLISIGDIRDLTYLKLDDLIEPGKNIYYYNSSICKYNDQYRLFYRCGNNPKTCDDRIATCLLTKNLEVVPNTNKYIDLYSNWEASRKCGPDNTARHIQYFYEDVGSMKSFVFKDNHHVEDPRAIEFNNHWFVFYTDGLTIGVAKLTLDTCDVIYSHYFKLPPRDMISNQSDGREKNWIPVVSNNQLYILYSDTPRTIFRCRDDLDELTVVTREKFDYSVTWPYGNVRGGCPPVPYDNDTLIWFFHSSRLIYFSITVNNPRIYFIGAYVTENKYPFNILKISTFPIFFGTPCHYRKNIDHRSNIVFPCGAVQEGDTFLISMGINDHCIGHLKINKNDIIWKDLMKVLHV
jgi:predicted GH43/DUF377 family glycosyl hydrolase